MEIYYKNSKNNPIKIINKNKKKIKYFSFNKKNKKKN